VFNKSKKVLVKLTNGTVLKAKMYWRPTWCLYRRKKQFLYISKANSCHRKNPLNQDMESLHHTHNRDQEKDSTEVLPTTTTKKNLAVNHSNLHHHKYN